MKKVIKLIQPKLKWKQKLIQVKAIDKIDSLKGFKEKIVNNPSLIYLDGNSLEKLPLKTIETTSNIVKNQWENF